MVSRLHSTESRMSLLQTQSFFPSALTIVARGRDSAMLAVICDFDRVDTSIDVRLPEGPWTLRLNSSDHKWHGPGNAVPMKIESTPLKIKMAAQSFVVFERLNSIVE